MVMTPAHRNSAAADRRTRASRVGVVTRTVSTDPPPRLTGSFDPVVRNCREERRRAVSGGRGPPASTRARRWCRPGS